MKAFEKMERSSGRKQSKSDKDDGSGGRRRSKSGDSINKGLDTATDSDDEDVRKHPRRKIK